MSKVIFLMKKSDFFKKKKFSADKKMACVTAIYISFFLGNTFTCLIINTISLHNF